MTDNTLLIVAAVVFVFLIIGLVLTVYEFKANIMENSKSKRSGKR